MKLQGLSDKAIGRISKILKGQESIDKDIAGEIALDKVRYHSMGNPYNVGEFDLVYSIEKKGPMPGLYETKDLGPGDKWFLVQVYHEEEDSIADYAVIDGVAHLVELD